MGRVAPVIELNPITEAALNHLVRSAATPQGLALRSRIVLAAAAGRANQQIAAALQIPEVTVGKWRHGFVSKGLDGLQDLPRNGRPPKHGDVVAAFPQRENPRSFVWTKGPRKLQQRIIEATKEYQTTHPRKPGKRRRKVDTIKN